MGNPVTNELFVPSCRGASETRPWNKHGGCYGSQCDRQSTISGFARWREHPGSLFVGRGRVGRSPASILPARSSSPAYVSNGPILRTTKDMRFAGLGRGFRKTRSFRSFPWTDSSPECLPPTGTSEPLLKTVYASALVAPICSISGRPAWFYCFFDLSLSRAAHPGAVVPSDFPGPHNILWVFFLATQ